jgi:hypothetical protein
MSLYFISSLAYGLLGDDHGVLTLNDLAINACFVVPKQFKATSPYYPYEYWQCFKSKSISFDCDSNGIPDEHDGVMGLIVAKVTAHEQRYEYMTSRFWPIKDCKRFLRDVALLFKSTKCACVSGSYINKDKDSSDHLSTSWLFGRIKTKKGCEGHHCDFTRKFKKENCPTLKL